MVSQTLPYYRGIFSLVEEVESQLTNTQFQTVVKAKEIMSRVTSANSVVKY